MFKLHGVLWAVLAVPLALGACSDGDSTEPTDTEEPAWDGKSAPPAGEGFQFQTQDTVVEPGHEAQDCYFFKISELAKAGGLPEDEPVHLHKIQLHQEEGSHHMNIFKVRTIVALDPANGPVQKGLDGTGECFKSPNWADWPLVANTQVDGQIDWTYPDGVANVFQPDEWIMLQTHYVNGETQKTPNFGHVTVNFWTIPAAEMKYELGTLFATKQSIRICESNKTPTFDGTCQFNNAESINLIGANAHFHSRGVQFGMYSWDGTSETRPADSERFYQSKAWDEPPMMRSPELNEVVPPNSGIWYTCSYQWQEPPAAIGCDGLNAFDQTKYMTPEENLDCCYTFGPVVDRNEHCNIFVYYYPKVDDINCF
jgi:hypothetical protein